MARYPNIVFNGLYLVLAYIERLISTVSNYFFVNNSIFCHFFSYFGMSMNFSSWVCKLHKIFMTCAETKAISMFEGF